MKKLLLLALISFLAITAALAQPAPRIGNLGLVSELAYIKSSSEQTVMMVLADSNLSQADRYLVMTQYNDVRLQYDQVILQLMSDCRRGRNVRTFKRLDNALCNKSIDYLWSEEVLTEQLRNYTIALYKGSQYQKKLLNTADSLMKLKAGAYVSVVLAYPAAPATPGTWYHSERIAVMLGEIRLRELQIQTSR